MPTSAHGAHIEVVKGKKGCTSVKKQLQKDISRCHDDIILHFASLIRAYQSITTEQTSTTDAVVFLRVYRCVVTEIRVYFTKFSNHNENRVLSTTLKIVL